MTCFHMLAGGRTYPAGFYKNDSALAGDMSLLALRYNNVYSGMGLHLQPKTQKRITVTAPDTVWWREYVFTNKDLAGRDQDIVHLLNGPLVMSGEKNPESKMRPPVGPIRVRSKGRNGKMPTKAWLVMAEALTPSDPPRVQAVPLAIKSAAGEAVVTVPALLYFKSVVFEY